VLSNEATRELYDIDLHGSKMEEELGLNSNEPLSEWVPATDPAMAKNTNADETRALFVDEVSCIGCKQCCWAARNTFVLDAQWGRARVARQWADTEEDLKIAAGALQACAACTHDVHAPPAVARLWPRDAPGAHTCACMQRAARCDASTGCSEEICRCWSM
jgi:ferredoxin